MKIIQAYEKRKDSIFRIFIFIFMMGYLFLAIGRNVNTNFLRILSLVFLVIVLFEINRFFLRKSNTIRSIEKPFIFYIITILILVNLISVTFTGKGFFISGLRSVEVERISLFSIDYFLIFVVSVNLIILFILRAKRIKNEAQKN